LLWLFGGAQPLLLVVWSTFKAGWVDETVVEHQTYSAY